MGKSLILWESIEGEIIGKDRGQKEKRESEDEVAGWHHRCNGHKLEQISGDGETCDPSGVTKSQTQLGN